MKNVVTMRIRAHCLAGGAEALLQETGSAANVESIDKGKIYDIEHVIVWLKFDEGDARIAKVIDYVERQNVKPWVLRGTEYSEEDRQSARLLWMRRDINENVHSGIMYGTKYDMEAACSNCGAGAKLTAALYIDGDDGPALIRKHRAIGTWDGDVLVDGGMAKKLKEAGVTGISFGEVRARLKNKKWSMVAREQILISHTMPPMRSDLANEDPKYLCKVCQRGGRMHVPDKPYRAEDLEGMQDFNLTWEWFGEFWPKDKIRHAKRPSPSVLVTPKVMNIFREAGVKTFEWTPVFVEK